MANEARITQAMVEVIREGEPKARITQAMCEVIREGNPKARITQVMVEVCRRVEQDVADARLSSFFLVM